MTYFDEYFLKGYKARAEVREYRFPCDIEQKRKAEEQKCIRNILRNSYVQYRTEKRNTDALRKLLMDYKKIVEKRTESYSKRRYNVFVYKYMVDIFIGNKAIASKMNVSVDTVQNDLRYVLDDLVLLCIGLPAASGNINSQRKCIQFMLKNKDLLLYPVGNYVDAIWCQYGQIIREWHKKSVEITEQMLKAADAYMEYCRDKENPSEVDGRKADMLEDNLNGMSYEAIAEKYGCSIDTIYDNMRDNETRLAQMLFV